MVNCPVIGQPFQIWVRVDCVYLRVFRFSVLYSLDKYLTISFLLSPQMLEFVRLDANNFHGTLPVSIGLMPRLEWLQLDHNDLTGTIPTEWGESSRLHTLNLANTQISGSIPAGLGALPLVHFWVRYTRLTGEVPESFGSLNSLRELHQDNTELGGTMPTEVCSLLDNGDMEVLTADCNDEIECSCCTKCF